MICATCGDRSQRPFFAHEQYVVKLWWICHYFLLLVCVLEGELAKDFGHFGWPFFLTPFFVVLTERELLSSGFFLTFQSVVFPSRSSTYCQIYTEAEAPFESPRKHQNGPSISENIGST